MSMSALNAVFYYSQSKSGERCVLFAIADAINDDTGTTMPYIETIATKANLSPRRVKGMLPRLVARGELIIIQRVNKSHIYAIPILYGEDGYDPQPCEDTTHTCGGLHTPLSVTRTKAIVSSRDARRRILKAAVKGEQGFTPSQKKTFGVKKGSPQGEEGFTPEVKKGSPQGEEGFTQYPLVPNHVPSGVPNAQERETFIPPQKTETPKTHTAPSWTQVMAWEQSDAGRDWYRYNLRGRDPQLLPSGQRFDAYEKATLHGEVQS